MNNPPGPPVVHYQSTKDDDQLLRQTAQHKARVAPTVARGGRGRGAGGRGAGGPKTLNQLRQSTYDHSVVPPPPPAT